METFESPGIYTWHILITGKAAILITLLIVDTNTRDSVIKYQNNGCALIYVRDLIVLFVSE